MFQFRRFPAYAYFVQRTLTEYCSAGFPHSVIRGYNAYVRLPTAYRSLSRPSSALDAKAFPLRSFQLDLLARLRAYLDQEILVLTRIMQASDSVHCSICVTHFKSSTIKTLLPLCCLLAISCLLHCSVFKVQTPTFFKVRLKCSPYWTNTSI